MAPSSHVHRVGHLKLSSYKIGRHTQNDTYVERPSMRVLLQGHVFKLSFLSAQLHDLVAMLHAISGTQQWRRPGYAQASYLLSYLHMQSAVQDHDFTAPICEGTLRLLHHHSVPCFHNDRVRLPPVSPACLPVSFTKANGRRKCSNRTTVVI